MPDTWVVWSQEVLGYVPALTEHTERYVALKKIQGWLNQGLTARQIALKWNSGRHDKCVKGVNRQGVAYDSCTYSEKVVSLTYR